MPTRILRDGINESDAVNALSEAAEILYRRLFSVVDDFGRFDGRASIIRGRCFGLQLDRWPAERIEQCLIECSRTRSAPDKPALVTLYEHDGKKYLQINNFGQRERTPKYPAPPPCGVLPQTAANCGELRQTAATCGDLPPTRARPHSESESYSESESSAKSETRGGTPPLPGNGVSVWESDDSYSELRKAWDDAGGFGWSEHDWGAARPAWRKLDPDQRLKAIEGIRARSGLEDFVLRAKPENLIRQRMWTRQIRAPAVSIADRERKRIENL